MTKILELKTDRSLIKANFDGYKLSLESVPVIKVELAGHQYPCIQKPNSDQYSFLHTELFSMQNLLVQDPWNRESSYFVGKNGSSIYCSNYREGTGRPNPLRAVFEFTEQQVPEKTGRYNFSFKFISEKYCLFCDGYNRLCLFDTADRYKITDWKLIFSHTIVEEVIGFILKDARLDIFEGNKVVNCAFQHIESENSKHSNQLYWGVLSKNTEENENKWMWQLKDILFGKDLVYYCAFESKSTSIILCTSKTFTFNSISNDKEEVNGENQETIDSIEIVNTKKADNLYTWTQTEDDIMISFNRIECEDKDDFKVECTDETITVKCKDECLLDNEKFCQKVDSELTTWAVENAIFKITLMKKDCVIWPNFIENGPLETIDETAENCEIENKPIPNLETPIEDCDVAFNTDDEYFVDRINLETKTVTHQVPLGNNPPLFSTILRPGFPAAIATRTDVDASLWLQQYNPAKPEEWALRHEGNLHAFGYIQASKQQKKYIDCAPDLGYSAISESFRHVFIYNSKYETANNLRNRSGPQVSLGKQNLVTLESTGEVLGMSCGINFITLLSEKCLLYVQINKLDS